VNLNLVAKQVKIHLTPQASKYILDKTCGDRSYGARPLRRALQKYIEDPLSEALIQGTLPRPSELEVYLGDTGIFYRKIGGDAAGEVAVTAGAPEEQSAPVAPAPGTLLFTF
jgi:ATP-dependent Clp protease ATP-binding subunit ClpC